MRTVATAATPGCRTRSSSIAVRRPFVSTDTSQSSPYRTGVVTNRSRLDPNPSAATIPAIANVVPTNADRTGVPDPVPGCSAMPTPTTTGGRAPCRTSQRTVRGGRRGIAGRPARRSTTSAAPPIVAAVTTPTAHAPTRSPSTLTAETGMRLERPQQTDREQRRQRGRHDGRAEGTGDDGGPRRGSRREGAPAVRGPERDEGAPLGTATGDLPDRGLPEREQPRGRREQRAHQQPDHDGAPVVAQRRARGHRGTWTPMPPPSVVRSAKSRSATTDAPGAIRP